MEKFLPSTNTKIIKSRNNQTSTPNFYTDQTKFILDFISSILQGFFHAGNVDKSDRYTARDMHSELMKMAEDGEINQESIPKIESIQSWIARYAAAYKTEASRNILNLMNTEV